MPPDPLALRQLGLGRAPLAADAARTVPAEAFEELGRRLAQVLAEDQLLTARQAAELLQISPGRFAALEAHWIEAGLKTLSVGAPGGRRELRYSRASLLGLARAAREWATTQEGSSQ